MTLAKSYMPGKKKFTVDFTGCSAKEIAEHKGWGLPPKYYIESAKPKEFNLPKPYYSHGILESTVSNYFSKKQSFWQANKKNIAISLGVANAGVLLLIASALFLPIEPELQKTLLVLVTVILISEYIFISKISSSDNISKNSNSFFSTNNSKGDIEHESELNPIKEKLGTLRHALQTK